MFESCSCFSSPGKHAAEVRILANGRENLTEELCGKRRESISKPGCKVMGKEEAPHYLRDLQETQAKAEELCRSGYIAPARHVFEFQ